MTRREKDYPALIKTVREQLDLSQEDLAREIGVSFATVNRWENGQTKPSKLAKAQLEVFCVRMIETGRLDLKKDLMQCFTKEQDQQSGSRRGSQ